MKKDNTRNTGTASSKSTDVVPSKRALLRAASAAPVVLTAPNLAFAATASALDCLNTPPSSATVVTSAANDDNVFRVQVDVATYTLNDNVTVVDAYTVPGTPPQIITLDGADISTSFTPSATNPANPRQGFAIAYVDSDGMATGTIGHVTPGSTETLAFNSCLASIDMS